MWFVIDARYGNLVVSSPMVHVIFGTDTHFPASLFPGKLAVSDRYSSVDPQGLTRYR